MGTLDSCQGPTILGAQIEKTWKSYCVSDFQTILHASLFSLQWVILLGFRMLYGNFDVERPSNGPQTCLLRLLGFRMTDWGFDTEGPTNGARGIPPQPSILYEFNDLICLCLCIYFHLWSHISPNTVILTLVLIDFSTRVMRLVSVWVWSLRTTTSSSCNVLQASEF